MLPALNENQSNKTKSFWERKEGTTGMITLALLGVGGAFLAQAILPVLISVFTLGIIAVGKLITLGVLALILAAFVYVVTNKKVHTLVKYLFKSSMRAITGVFVTIDPIGIMKGYIETLDEKKSAYDEKKSKLRGQIEVFNQTITENERKADHCANMMVAAQKQNQPRELQFNSRERTRLLETNQKLIGTLNKMKTLFTTLTKYGEACDFIIRDMRSDVKIKEQERKMMLTGHSAISSAMAILKGSDDERELFDQAMEFVVEDYAQKMGEIDDFLESTETIISGINLQNGMWEEKALKELESWERKSESLVLGGEKRLMIENSNLSAPLNFGNTVRETVPVKSSGDDFNRFFNKP